jgi:hypothetical protein
MHNDCHEQVYYLSDATQGLPDNYLRRKRVRSQIIITITRTTRKIPTPMPALKIPPITSQELNVSNNSKLINNNEDKFFIFGNLSLYMQMLCHGNVSSKS